MYVFPISLPHVTSQVKGECLGSKVNRQVCEVFHLKISVASFCYSLKNVWMFEKQENIFLAVTSNLGYFHSGKIFDPV